MWIKISRCFFQYFCSDTLKAEKWFRGQKFKHYARVMHIWNHAIDCHLTSGQGDYMRTSAFYQGSQKSCYQEKSLKSSIIRSKLAQQYKWTTEAPADIMFQTNLKVSEMLEYSSSKNDRMIEIATDSNGGVSLLSAIAEPYEQSINLRIDWVCILQMENYSNKF